MDEMCKCTAKPTQSKGKTRPITALASKDECSGVTLNATVLNPVISEVRLKGQEIQ